MQAGGPRLSFANLTIDLNGVSSSPMNNGSKIISLNLLSILALHSAHASKAPTFGGYCRLASRTVVKLMLPNGLLANTSPIQS
jgi:hypothetical protein